MADRAYLTKSAAPPSAPKLFLDQQVIPRLIDAAALAEAAVEQVADRARRTPISTCAIVLCLGWSLGFLVSENPGRRAGVVQNARLRDRR